MVLIFDWSRASLLICVWSQHGVRLRDRRHWLPRESLWLRCQRPSYSLPCDSPLRRHWLPRAFPPRHSLPCESLLRLWLLCESLWLPRSSFPRCHSLPAESPWHWRNLGSVPDHLNVRKLGVFGPFPIILRFLPDQLPLRLWLPRSSFPPRHWPLRLWPLSLWLLLCESLLRHWLLYESPLRLWLPRSFPHCHSLGSAESPWHWRNLGSVPDHLLNVRVFGPFPTTLRSLPDAVPRVFIALWRTLPSRHDL